ERQRETIDYYRVRLRYRGLALDEPTVMRLAIHWWFSRLPPWLSKPVPRKALPILGRRYQRLPIEQQMKVLVECQSFLDQEGFRFSPAETRQVALGNLYFSGPSANVAWSFRSRLRERQ